MGGNSRLDLAELRSQRFEGDGLTINTNSFTPADQMGRCVASHLVTRLGQYLGKVSANRSLAIGASHMNDRNLLMRISQICEQLFYPLQTQMDPKPPKATQDSINVLGDAGIYRLTGCEISTYAHKEKCRLLQLIGQSAHIQNFNLQELLQSLSLVQELLGLS